MEKAYTLRPLAGKDIYAVMRIINRIGIEEVKSLFASSNVKNVVANAMKTGKVSSKDELVASVGIQVALDIICMVTSHIPDCENEVNGFLSSLSGMTVEEVANLDLLVYTEMIEDVVNKQEFRSFFTHVLRLLGLEI